MKAKTLWAVKRENGKWQPKLGTNNYGDIKEDYKSMMEFLKEAESYGAGVVYEFMRYDG